jgi:hypothetical protein
VPPDRKTPTPEPGEWTPQDRELTRWRLVCRVCGDGSGEVEAPLDREERRRIALEFLEKHEGCVRMLRET